MGGATLGELLDERHEPTHASLRARRLGAQDDAPTEVDRPGEETLALAQRDGPGLAGEHGTVKLGIALSHHAVGRNRIARAQLHERALGQGFDRHFPGRAGFIKQARRVAGDAVEQFHRVVR